MYDILRARITRINEKTLEEHFDVERVSGEFTREFNITTTSLPNRVLAGKKEISSSETKLSFSSPVGNLHLLLQIFVNLYVRDFFHFSTFHLMQRSLAEHLEPILWLNTPLIQKSGNKIYSKLPVHM